MRDAVTLFVDKVSMILRSDLRQLPPVRSRCIYNKDTTSFAGAETIWRILHFYPLTQVIHQSGVAFTTVLTKIGGGDRLTQDITDLMESRFIAKSQARQTCPYALRLFLNIVLSRHPDVFNSVATDVMIGYNAADLEAFMLSKIHKMTVAGTAGLHYKMSLVSDKMYTVSSNIDVFDVLTNGSMCTLKHIGFQDDGLLHRVQVRGDSSKVDIAARAKALVCATLVGLNTKWIPIHFRTAPIQLKPILTSPF